MSLYKPQGWKCGKKVAAYGPEFTVHFTLLGSVTALGFVTAFCFFLGYYSSPKIFRKNYGRYGGCYSSGQAAMAAAPATTDPAVAVMMAFVSSLILCSPYPVHVLLSEVNTPFHYWHCFQI